MGCLNDDGSWRQGSSRIRPRTFCAWWRCTTNRQVRDHAQRTLYLVPTGSLHAVLQYRRRWLLASELTNHSLDLLVMVDALLAGSIMGNQGIDRCSCLPLCMRKFLRISILSIIVRRIICRRGLHHVCPSVCAPGEGRFPDARAFPAISKSDLTVGTLASLDFGV